MWERNDRLPLIRAPTGDQIFNQACGLTGNWTGDLLVCGTTSNQLSHTGQGDCLFSYHRPLRVLYIFWIQILYQIYSYKYFFRCLIFSSTFIFIYLLLERGEGREKERERNINVWEIWTQPSTQPCALTGGPDWQPFGLQAGAQSTEPHQPGPIFSSFYWRLSKSRHFKSWWSLIYQFLILWIMLFLS